ncbi:alpha/beta hydrolase [Desulfovibrio sp. JC010]|uniref:alpha/beta hydrolase n=1 Tax=Desulfovibrio sp. JC010 TaxID=2593641 RepID=UPI0013D1FF7A|nr:alpha/beta hydrolase [Desulfovibrio sp. JC010]NDV25824.1 alpha/beta hydrolase [Desulfovibrio sp. JC010]
MKKLSIIKTAAIALTLVSLLLTTGCSKSSTDTINKWGDDLTKALTTENPFQEIVLFYGTDRQPSGSTVPGKAYGNEGGKLSWGACNVAVPFSKDLKELKKSGFTMTTYGMRPVSDYTIKDVQPLPRRSFNTTLPKRLANSPDKSALVFVHGFDISFEEAALSTARMSYELQYQGAPLFFSWPAQSDYLQDEQNAEHAIPQLTEFIKEVAEELDAENIYLIGNSMGCLPLCKAMAELQLAPEDMARIKELILIAPDINRNKFAETILPKLDNTSAHITVYTSSNDDQLTTAHKQRGGVRLGDVVDNKDLPGIDFVDATKINTSMNGKGKFVKKTSIYNDIASVIK